MSKEKQQVASDLEAARMGADAAGAVCAIMLGYAKTPLVQAMGVVGIIAAGWAHYKLSPIISKVKAGE